MCGYVLLRYEVFSIDTSNQQVELSACAGPDAKWILAPVAEFPQLCGGWDLDDNSASDDGGGNDDGGQVSCEPDAHGPPCRTDEDCSPFAGCVRCASSGYCTEVPL